MTVKRIGFTYGVIIGLFLVIYGYLYRVAKLESFPLTIWVFYIALPVGAFLAQRAFQRARDGVFRWRQAAGTSAWVSCVGSAIYCSFVYVYNAFVDDSLVRSIYENTLAQATQKGLSGAELESTLAWARTLSDPAVFSLFVFVQLTLFGIITSSVAGVFLSRRARTAASVAHPAVT